MHVTFFRMFYLITLILFVVPSFLYGRLIESSSPYLSGDTFRSMCDFYFDEVTTSFAPEKVQPGARIFVKTDMLDRFFQTKHPFIKSPYILVSHNSDGAAPGAGRAFLDDPKIVAWFAQNVEMEHPKLHPIPIGLANKMWNHGNVSILEVCRPQIGTVLREKLLYMNFTIGTNVSERRKAYSCFATKKFCFSSRAKPWKEYLQDLLSVRFVLSPRGNGLDCHRTWEALYMGAIPIVKESHMDSVFEGLPVLIIKNWEHLTEEYLQNAYQVMMQKVYSTDKLYAAYWKSLFQWYTERAKQQAQESVSS